jgi:MSHA biogenesis protein MshK
MADLVMRHLVTAAAGALAVLWSAASPAQTGGLPDPTRPPTFSEAPAASAPAPAGLQAVLLRPHGRSVAVINGQTVAVGEKVGEARLVSLTANEAVLSGPNGKEVLKLAPAVDKKQMPSTPPAAEAQKRIPRRGDSHD